MLLGTLGASLLGSILAEKGAIATSQGRRVNRAREGAIAKSVSKDTRSRDCKSWLLKQKSSKNNKKQKEFLMSLHTLTNFEIQKDYHNLRFNGVYSRDNLPKIKHGAYEINLDECSDIETHWIVLYVLNNDVTYFDSFGVEHIPKEIKTFIGNKNIKTKIFRIQAYDSIMCGYVSVGFIDFMLAGKTLTDFSNLFLPNDF